MGFQAGSLPWLLQHELRLWWRELRGKWVLLILGLLAALAFGVPIALWFSVLILAPAAVPGGVSSILISPDFEPALLVAVAASLLILFFAFLQSIGYCLRAMFERNDLDLLVSSPLSLQVIFASRLLIVALEAFLGFWLVPIIPVLSLVAVLSGQLHLLGIYPTLGALCLIAASLAMLTVLGLVRWLGAKRARIVAQIVSSLLYAAFVLSLQLPNWLRFTPSKNRLNWAAFFTIWRDHPLLSSHSWLWFPARAIFFDLPSLLLLLLLAGGLVWLAISTQAHMFLYSTRQSLTTSHRPTRQRSSRFASNLNWIFLLKEWRLILRNPFLLSQVFLSLLFLVVGLVPLLGMNRPQFFDIERFAAVVLPLMGSSLASALTTLSAAGEEAADLLKSAPVNGQTLRRLKLLAALIPVWCLGLPPLLFLFLQGETRLATIAIFLAATTCTAVVRLWNARPVSLAGMMQRQRQKASQDILLSILEGLLLYSWCFIGFQVASTNWPWSAVGLVVIGVLLTIAYWRSRHLGSLLGF